MVFQARDEGGVDRAAAGEQVKSKRRACSKGHRAGFADGLGVDLGSKRNPILMEPRR